MENPINDESDMEVTTVIKLRIPQDANRGRALTVDTSLLSCS